MDRKLLGEYLVDAGALTAEEIRGAVESKDRNQKIGDYLVEHGYVSEEILYEKLSEQLKIPLVRLKDVRIDSELIDVFEMDSLKAYEVFPLELTGSVVTLVSADPLNNKVIEDLEKSMGYDFTTVFGLRSEVLKYIDKYYGINEDIMGSFGISEELSGFKRDVTPVLKMVQRELVNRSVVEIHMRQTGKRRVDVLSGELEGLTKADYMVLLEFMKEVTGYEGDYGYVYSEELSDVGVGLSLIEAEVFGVKEYRIVMKKDIEDERKENADIILWQVSGRDARMSVERQIKEKVKKGNRISIISNDRSYDRLGCLRKEVGDEVYKLVDFTDVFVVADAWKEDVGEVVVDLMMRGKDIVMVYPGDFSQYRIQLERDQREGSLLMMENLYGDLSEKTVLKV